jgi:hypothetical protein
MLVARPGGKEGNMGEAETAYKFSSDRLKLLWLLLRKRGIDFVPQQIHQSKYAEGQIKKESGPEPAKQNNRGDPLSKK